ncbi:MAG: glycosyltransferase family 4 protein [Runella sp.]
MKEVNIIIVTSAWPPQTHGLAEVAYQHAIGLHQLGYNLKVITRQNEVDDMSFEVIKIKNKIEYQAILQKIEADVIFFHGWHHWVTDWVKDCLPLNLKSVLVSHGTHFNIRFEGRRGWFWWLRKRPVAWRFASRMKRFDHYVFLSDFAEKQRMSDLRWVLCHQKSNYTIIPNGASLAFLPPPDFDFRKTFGINSSKILLCVSNFHYAKGQEELIKWIAQMQISEVALVLIGSEENQYSARLRQIAAQYPTFSVHVLTRLDRNQIHAAYCAADVFVSATYTEVQPLMLLDAMAVGLPFLCRAVGTVPTLRGGMCYDTPQEFQQKLTLLLNEPTLKEQYAFEGRHAVAEYYNWPRVIEKYNKLIQKLLIDVTLLRS